MTFSSSLVANNAVLQLQSSTGWSNLVFYMFPYCGSNMAVQLGTGIPQLLDSVRPGALTDPSGGFCA